MGSPRGPTDRLSIRQFAPSYPNSASRDTPNGPMCASRVKPNGKPIYKITRMAIRTMTTGTMIQDNDN